MKTTFAALMIALSVGGLTLPSFGCGGGTTVSMVIDTKLETPTLPAVETSTPSTNVRPTEQVM
ncbi:MAG TPA: hypothetical protein VFF73_11650 [Planctomycetota bacterium]|nr:hypothetical protein [Planctomycetota bacterium]